MIERTKAEIRPSSPRTSRISSTTARYSLLELADAPVRRLRVGILLDLDAKLAGRVGVCGAGDAAVEPGQGDRTAAAGEPDLLRDLRDGADRCVFAIVDGNEQNALLVADVDGERDSHVREDDDVLQWDQEKRCHVVHLTVIRCV